MEELYGEIVQAECGLDTVYVMYSMSSDITPDGWLGTRPETVENFYRRKGMASNDPVRAVTLAGSPRTAMFLC